MFILSDVSIVIDVYFVWSSIVIDVSLLLVFALFSFPYSFLPFFFFNVLDTSLLNGKIFDI